MKPEVMKAAGWGIHFTPVHSVSGDVCFRISIPDKGRSFRRDQYKARKND